MIVSVNTCSSSTCAVIRECMPLLFASPFFEFLCLIDFIIMVLFTSFPSVCVLQKKKQLKIKKMHIMTYFAARLKQLTGGLLKSKVYMPAAIIRNLIKVSV